ncbi:MAG TPA: ABC transporter permease [Thermoanaerobaculia bacterium]|jgi:putative ABC transport system permease protein|nr:ABC transporter permease [Thermoanaerobaculia bacterium]
MKSPARVPVWADRVYSTLLLAYPASFREEYRGEMRAAFRSRWREEEGTIWLWISVLLDTLATAAREHFEMLARDVRYAWRSLTGRGNWSFTAAALLTLALGIGAVTAIFTVVHSVLLAPLPYREPDRVIYLTDTHAARGIDEFASSMPNFLSWREAARSFSSLVAIRGIDVNLTEGDKPERANGLGVSAEMWKTLGIAPVAGRSFVPADDVPGHAPVAMISEGLWRRRYGGETSLIGRTIDVNLVPRVVVGVIPQDVGFVDDVDVWLPLGRDPEADDSRGDRRLIVLGRLAPGVTLQQAQEEMERISVQLEREFPEANEGWRVRVVPIRDWIVDEDIGQRLRILLAAVALLLLVAATNVANLQIARAGGRVREIAVRLALGASRARLVRQMITESLVLTIAGGAAGLGLAWFAIRAAAAVPPETVPRLGSLSLNLPVLLVAVLCIGVTALLAGMLPASVAVRSGVHGALQSSASRSATGSRAPARQALVAVQLALATALVVCAALLTQSLVRLQNVPLGFADPDHLLTARITRSVATEDATKMNQAFYDSVLEGVRALPGVVSAAVTSEVPFGPMDTGQSVVPIPRPESVSEDGIQASWRLVTADYFQTLRIPLRRGRVFTPDEKPQRNLLLSEGLARRLWPGGEDPVGREVKLSNGQTHRVIGVVGDVRQVGLAEDPTPTFYWSTARFVTPTMTLVVRTATEPTGLAQSIRQVVARVDPRQPVSDFQTMRTAVRTNAAAPRLNTILLASFAGMALLLAVVGVAGVVGYAVGQRTRELAVRLALGASPGQAVRLVMRGGLLTCTIGILTGLAAALAAGRLLSGVLFGVDAYDPATFLMTAAALFAAAAWACWLPARRVTGISPSLTLRDG